MGKLSWASFHGQAFMGKLSWASFHGQAFMGKLSWASFHAWAKRSSVACRYGGAAMAATMRTPRAPLNHYRKSVSR
jgi:hypothetical protein